jgi:hypothetical protein
VDREELDDRQRVAEEEADSLKRAAPRITLLNEPLRHHEGDGALTTQSTSQLGEDGQVGLQPNPFQSPDAKR